MQQLQMTGVYRNPTFYTKVVSSQNELIIKSKNKNRFVVSKDVASLLKQLLIEPVKGKNGTATYCSIPKQDVAAKTGTTNENYDRWLCGFTNNYTTICWFGFDKNESIDYYGKNPAGLMWIDVMSKIHSNLPSSKFTITNGLTSINICKDSGKIATSHCKNTYTEYFLNGTVITDVCEEHR